MFPKKLFIALLALTPFCSHAQNALGINFAGDVFKFNTITGAGSLLGSSGLTNPNCMARANDKWYTVDNQARLCLINPTTGLATPIQQLNLGGNTDVRGLCFDVNLGMFVVVNNTSNDQLWKVDQNGDGTLVGSMNSTTIQGLMVAFNGRLYAYDVSTTNTGGLRLVDPNTGATTDLDPAAPGQGGIQDLCPSGGGVLGGRDSLFNIDPASGAESLIGTGGYSDLRGLARRQNTFQVDSMTVRLGRLDSGNVSSILRREGTSALISKFIVPNQQVDPIQVEVVYGTEITPAELNELGFYFIGQMNTSGSFTLSFDLLNVNTGQFEQLATTSINTSVKEFVTSASAGLAKYFNANKRLTLRLRIKPAGPVANPNWGVLIEMMRAELIASF